MCALYKLSGIESVGKGKLKAKVKQAQHKAVEAVKHPKQAVKNAVYKAVDTAKHPKQAFKKATKIIAKVGVAPSRGAALLLIGLNAFKLADRFKQAWDKDSGAVTKFWNGFGGDVDKLKGAINHGSKTGKISGYSDFIPKGGYVGEPATIATAITTATPIIIAIASFFKKLGIHKADDGLEGAIEDGKEGLVNDSDVEKTTADMDSDADVAKVRKKGSGEGVTDEEDRESGFGPIPIMIGLGVAGTALYLATKR